MSNQTIIGMAGRKQAGKGTSYTCIRLWRPEAVEFSFAEPLKRMCVDILGLEEQQAFGNDEQKRTLCPHLLWENFPLPAWEREDGTVFIGNPDNQRFVYNATACLTSISPTSSNSAVLSPILDSVTFKPEPFDPDMAWHVGNPIRRKRGAMMAREVLQYYGTEIFRKQYHNVWADACLRKIKKSGCSLAVITDCRFPNEVETIQGAGGRVIKLTRNPFPEDNHPSESSLDAGNFDQNRFDSILDNADLNINEQCEALYALLRRWNVVKSKPVSRMHV